MTLLWVQNDHIKTSDNNTQDSVDIFEYYIVTYIEGLLASNQKTIQYY